MLLPEYSTGIIFEVEQGKTTINNMNLLDLWKCHICAEAHHLFLLVPQVLQQNEDDPKVTRPFDYVRKRLPSFFREWQLHQRANLLAVRLLTTAGSWPGLQVGTVPEGRSYHENV